MKSILSLLLACCLLFSNAFAEGMEVDRAWLAEQHTQLQGLVQELQVLLQKVENAAEALQGLKTEDTKELYQIYKQIHAQLQSAPERIAKIKTGIDGLEPGFSESLQAIEKNLSTSKLRAETTQLREQSGLSSNLPPLPISLDPLNPPPVENFLSDTEYKDDSLSVKITKFEHEGSTCYVAYVKIADPSQLRTAISSERLKRLRTTSEMLERSGGVIAINGDYFSIRTTGFVLRQGKRFRSSNEKRRDLLLIDDRGDFHIIPRPSTKATKEITEQYNIVNSFSFGPALVINGEKQSVPGDYPFEGLDPGPRTAIAQMGALSYAMVVVDGRSKTSPGKTHQQMADLLSEIGALHAFGLDGGGTTSMSFQNQTVNVPAYNGERLLSDIILFASLHQTPKEIEENKK